MYYFNDKTLIPLTFVSRTITTYLKRQQYLKQFLTHAKQRRQRFDEHLSLPLPLPLVPLPCSRLLYGIVQHLPVGTIFLKTLSALYLEAVYRFDVVELTVHAWTLTLVCFHIDVFIFITVHLQWLELQWLCLHFVVKSILIFCTTKCIQRTRNGNRVVTFVQSPDDLSVT